MTKAEQPTITPEDRKAYAALYLKDQGEPHSVHDLSVAAEIEMGLHDDWDGVHAFAAHRKLHESTPENNLAGGLWYRRWFALADTRATSLAAQDGLDDHFPSGLRQKRYEIATAGDVVDGPVYVDCHCGASFSAFDEGEARQLWAEHALSAIKGDKS